MSNMQRPSAKETEEDLMKLQEEFFSSKCAPAASFVKKADKHKLINSSESADRVVKDVVQLTDPPASSSTSLSQSDPPKKKSKFAKDNSLKKKVNFKDLDPEELLDSHDRHITKVLTEIVERDTTNCSFNAPVFIKGFAFPKTFSVDAQKLNTVSGKKKSLFAQSLERMSIKDLGVANKPFLISGGQDSVITPKNAAGITARSSNIVTGTGLKESPDQEADRIHTENISTLAAMSEQEILAEQKRLLETLDPNIVTFLKSKRGCIKDENVSHSVHYPESSIKDIKSETKSSSHTYDIEAPLPIKPSKDWLNMSKQEGEKLEWIMKDLPNPVADEKKKSTQARFNLQGDILSVDLDVPVHLGLHHHGEEPERAGYSLEELFQLARSANVQQRTLALQVLSHIVKNAKIGIFVEALQTCLIPKLLESGITFLVRFALDDSVEPVVYAAIQTLHSLLVSPSDEEQADRVFCWYRGMQSGALCPVSSVDDNCDDDDDDIDDPNKEQKTDAEVIKEDLVKGLLRMMLIERLKYILCTFRPPPESVGHCLEILIRISRHSKQTAYQVMSNVTLMQCILKEFLPSVWEPVIDQSIKSVYGVPLARAMKFIRTLCSAGRNMAAIMVSKYKITECIHRFTAVEPSDLQLPIEEAYHLATESFRTWTVLTSYGIACESFSEMYSVLVKDVQQIPWIGLHEEMSKINRSISVVTLLEAMLITASKVSQRRKTVKFSLSEDQVHKVEDALPDVEWGQVSGLLPLVLMCTEKHMQRFMKSQKSFDTSLLSSLLNFLATYYSCVQQQPSYKAVDICDQIEHLSRTLLEPCLKCQMMKTNFIALRRYSSQLSTTYCPSRENSLNNPDFGSVVQVDSNYQEQMSQNNCPQLCPVLHKDSPFNFLSSVFHLLLTIGQLHKGLITKLFPLVLRNEDVIQYMRRLASSKPGSLMFNFFTKFESQTQYFLARMAVLSEKEGQSNSLLHQMVLHLVSRLQVGDEFLASKLFSIVLFNEDFFKSDLSDDISLCDIGISELSLSEIKYLPSATREELFKSHNQLLQDGMNNLVSIQGTFIQVFDEILKHTHYSHYLTGNDNCESLLSGPIGQALVPGDWMFFPIIKLYQKTLVVDPSQTLPDIVNPSEVKMISNMLRWVYMLHYWRPNTMNLVSVTTRITRLMCCFIAGSDLFLDSTVHCYLSALLREYCKPIFQSQIDLEAKIPGVVSFYDLYSSLLQQFEAVSFGDPVFASFILLPAQQQFDVKYRRAIWSEYVGVLRALFVPVKELLLPLKSFLEPEETDIELLQLYFHGLVHASVRKTSLMYLIALHHVNRFMYSQEEKFMPMKIKMLQYAHANKHKETWHHLIHFKISNENNDLGFDLYDVLPESRGITMRKAISGSS